MTKLGYASANLKSCEFFDENGEKINNEFELVVLDVMDEGEARKVGVRSGDIIIGYDDASIQTTCQLIDATSAKKHDSGFKKLVVRRGERTLEFNVKPGKLGIGIDNQPKATGQLAK